MGIGKTTTCQLLKQTLPNSVFLDGDWCWDMSPFQVTDETKEVVLQNICFMLNNFLSCSTFENIIFGWVLHKQEIIDRILAQLNTQNCTIKNISLVCNVATLTNRLQNDIDTGLRSADIIQHSTQRLALYTRLNTIKIDTTKKTTAQVCNAIIAI